MGKKIYVSLIKPLLDRVIALLLLILLLPLHVLIGILMALSLKGSPFFYQERPGENAKSFMLIKFRTLLVANDDQTTTRLGEFLRISSLDELPQLINVLKGEMSIIGPRPLLVEYLPFYNKSELMRHAVKPGITGWAQVNGRNSIDWGRRMEFDLYYVDHISFWLDMKILLKTITQLFKKEESRFENSTYKKFSDYASRR